MRLDGILDALLVVGSVGTPVMHTVSEAAPDGGTQVAGIFASAVVGGLVATAFKVLYDVGKWAISKRIEKGEGGE